MRDLAAFYDVLCIACFVLAWVQIFAAALIWVQVGRRAEEARLREQTAKQNLTMFEFQKQVEEKRQQQRAMHEATRVDVPVYRRGGQ